MSRDFGSNKETYTAEFSDEKFNKKIDDPKISTQLLRKVYQLYLVLKSPDTPMLVKAGILAVLGYFICPIDLVPDLVPIVGYGDDLTVVAAELATIAGYITPTIEREAAEKFQ